ncbi:MAG: hypothetical protein ACE5EG_03360, partial [Thermoanaerobaculia bacterium]
VLITIVAISILTVIPPLLMKGLIDTAIPEEDIRLVTLLGLGMDYLYGRTVLSKAVLYAAFPMAVILSGRSTYLKAYSPQVRWILLLGGVVGMFLLMLAVTWFADRI